MVASPASMQRFNLERRPAGLQEFPVPQQLFAMDFSPRFDEPLLRSRESAADALDRIKSEDRLEVLIRGVKMRPMVWCADFHEHSNNDSEESRNLWRRWIVTSRDLQDRKSTRLNSSH